MLLSTFTDITNDFRVLVKQTNIIPIPGNLRLTDSNINICLKILTFTDTDTGLINQTDTEFKDTDTDTNTAYQSR